MDAIAETIQGRDGRKLRLEDKDGKNPEMQEIWGLQRLWGHPLGRNTSVGNQNIYNGTWMEYDDAVSQLHVVIAYCYGNSSNSALKI